MSLTCESCGAEVLDIDVKCAACGHPLTSTGAYRMVGNVVLSHYEIVDVLGQGGMSVVYQGRHKLTGQEVALKILPPELAALSQVKSRFVEEAKALAQLDHPNIVHLYNFGEENGCFVLAMQYVRGQTFERIILESGTLDWPLASRITLDVLRALEYAHGRGIIHRDMKPSNVLVREHDGSATVMDFGIAKVTNSTRLTATGQTMGTVRYMSPEQVRGLPVDARTDIYSLGATLYEAVCGDTPFDGDTHFEIMTKHLHEPPPRPGELGIVLPAGFEDIVLRALAKEPDRRFPDARAFSAALEAVLQEHDIDWAGTMDRLRDSLAAGSRARPPAGPSVSATASTAQLRSADMGEEIAAPVRPVDSVEPSARHVRGAADGALSPPRDPAHDAARDEEPAGSRAGMWIALAGAAVLALAGVALYVTRTSSSAAPAPVTAASAPADAAARWPEPHLPPDVAFGTDQTYAEAELRVVGPAGWDAERVMRARREGHGLFAEILARAGLAEAIEAPPLTIAVVPQRVFCDARVYETGKVGQDCRDKEILYRPRDRTLLVVDDLDALEVNIAYGNAIAVCLHSQISGCDDAAGDIDKEYAQRRSPDKGRRR